LDANVILISSGGVGKPIDEFMLNKALLYREGVKLDGVIVYKVLPEKYESRLTVSRQQLIDAVRRVGLLARDSSPVRLEFNALGVKLSSSSPDLGQAVEAVEARYEGEDITAAFNPPYLADGLRAAPHIPRQQDETGIVRGQDSSYLVMPVRLPTPVG
jgi:DNA polymerase-3 subunit beta